MNHRIDRLERLTELRDKGALTEDEFSVEKAKILAPMRASFFEDTSGEAIKASSKIQEGSLQNNSASEHESSNSAAVPIENVENPSEIDGLNIIYDEESESDQSMVQKNKKLANLFGFIIALSSAYFLIFHFLFTSLIVLFVGIFFHLYGNLKSNKRSLFVGFSLYACAAAIFVFGSFIEKNYLGVSEDGQKSEIFKTYSAIDFKDILTPCLQFSALNGYALEKLSDETSQAKALNDEQKLMGMDAETAGRILSESINMITQRYIDDLEYFGRFTRRECSSAKSLIDKKFADVKNSKGSLIECHKVAEGMIAINKSAREYSKGNYVSWPDIRPHFDGCISSLNLDETDLRKSALKSLN